MSEQEWLAQRFEADRTHLRSVAYRMLGSVSEADDAVQEAWLRLSRADTNDVDNLSGWLTTVVARVCLDMLRSRESRREEALDDHAPETLTGARTSADPEHEAQLADSVGLALLVVLETLAPAERLAFVLHDMFAMPFEEIAPIVGRTPAAARQLASRARRRVRGARRAPAAVLAGQRRVVDAFLAALRAGDFEALVAVLDPDFVIRTDRSALPPGAPTEVRGARLWAKQALAFWRAVGSARLALVKGSVGLVMAPRGKLFRALAFTIAHGKVVAIDVVADPERLRQLELGVLAD